MSREIKFRGKTIPNHSTGLFWVYGNLLEWAGLFNIWEKDDDSDQRNYLVYPESVGQYTGLKDKNGKEIYEGDIIKYQDVRDGAKTKRKPVYFDNECGTWYCGAETLSNLLFEQNNDEWKAKEHWTIKENQYAVVIGNIYENGELWNE